MKKRLLLSALVILTALALAACGSDKEPEDEPPIDPAVTEIIPEATFQSSLTAPTPPPDGSVTWVGLASDSFGISLSYPSNWVNNPGKHTVCYYDPDTADTYLTRFAVTSKTLVHTPKKSAMPDHLKTYLKTISGAFKKKSFEIGELDDTGTFMGQKAWSTTYMGYTNDKKNIEVMGYVTMCNVDQTLYVFHYTSNLKAYGESEEIMTTIRDSIHLTSSSDTASK